VPAVIAQPITTRKSRTLNRLFILRPWPLSQLDEPAQMPATTRFYGSSGSTSLCYLIFNVADVGFERNQPSHIDQSIVSAAINIFRSVFAPAAGNDLTG
jgi:hypothetical protein